MKRETRVDGGEQLWEEMQEQPHVVARVLSDQNQAVREAARALKRHAPRGVIFVARGSSDHAAVYGRYLLEIRNRLLAPLAAPSTLTLYGARPKLEGFAVVGVSQSGQGEDVRAYVEAARRSGALTLAVVNDAQSPLARAVELPLLCGAGVEKSVPATKTVLAQMTLLAALSSALSRTPLALEKLPDAVEAALEGRALARKLARRLVKVKRLFVLGRGFAYSPALEIALKLKEMAYVQAEAFSAADFRHGPIALVERGRHAICVDAGGFSSAPCADAVAEVERRGGAAFLLGARASTRRARETVSGKSSVRGARSGLTLPLDIDEALAPLPVVVLGQLLALELSLALGLDPASPRGLSKVTRTR